MGLGVPIPLVILEEQAWEFASGASRDLNNRTWKTTSMLFQLGRQDVLRINDFGLRNGFCVAYHLIGVRCRKRKTCYDTESIGDPTGPLPPGICGVRLIVREKRRRFWASMHRGLHHG